MKTAIYIEDGLLQLVLTPETPIEKEVLDKARQYTAVSTHNGSFYPCRGGYVRQGSDDDSVIIVCRKPEGT